VSIDRTEDYAPTLSHRAEAWRVGDDRAEPVERMLAEEAPVGLAYDGKPHVVLMATPADVRDLAVGFTVTEKIAALDQIHDVKIERHPAGFSVDITLDESARASRRAARTRTMEGRSSCGLCGVQRLSAAVRSLEPVTGDMTLDRSALHAALEALEAEQALGRITRAMHAAAWADASGRLLAVREDVGRHNGLDPAKGFVLITSRCSYEMVEKAAVAGFPILVAISAPTALAIRKAEEAGITLVALARRDGHMVFTRPDRIVGARTPAEVPA
jgi:FdhD protein